jgi:hypothetical protein
MRRAHLCTAIGVALALMICSAAQADIGPVLKPEAPVKAVEPVAKPTTQTTQTAKQQTAQGQQAQQKAQQPPEHTQTSTQTPTHTATHTATHAPAVTPVIASGGREAPASAPVVRTTRHRSSLPSRIARLFPTRLAAVGHDPVPSYDTWPSWVLGAFTLLATAEAFLLVRLARSRRFERDGLREL